MAKKMKIMSKCDTRETYYKSYALFKIDYVSINNLNYIAFNI